MSGPIRIDPRRASVAGPNGLRRTTMRKQAAVSDETADKPLRTCEPPAQWLMAIAHSDRGSLDDHARQAIAAAAILAGPKTGVLAVILGEFNGSLADTGADLVAAFSEFDRNMFQPDRELAVLLNLIERYAPKHIFFPDNASGDGDLGRRLIAQSGNLAATRVAELDADHVRVPWSSGSASARAPLPKVILLAAGAVDGDLPFVGANRWLASSEIQTVPATNPVCRDLGLEETEATAIALEEADFIVSGGYGVSNVATLEALANTLGAAVGASRVAVDEGKFSRDKQIGASGRTVTATAYIAVGISGAVQHLQGIKDCRHVIAINKDAGAPIAKRADLTVIGDAEDVMQALIIRIAQARAQREIQEVV
jgi:electron transfer flavoprotein alpha subunit